MCSVLVACSQGTFPGFEPGTQVPGGGTPGDGTQPTTGCGSRGGGANGGPADLFPCDSPWYRDVSSLPVAPESSVVLTDLQTRGGWGLGDELQIGFDFALIHGGAAAPRKEVRIQPRDANDGNDYYPGESDLVAPSRGWSVPTPAGGQLEGESSYACPQSTSGGILRNQHDCHLTVVDDARHLLIELYGAWIDPGSGAWYATQESVWNLDWHYGAGQRGRGCTSADAAGLAISPGVIGLRETLNAVERGAPLQHALRFILPPDRTRRAFVAPAAHVQIENALLSSGPPYGVRFRLKPSFDESRVTTPGGRVLVRTLKKHGMILADGGQTALTADDESYLKQIDPALSWSGTLGPFDLYGIRVGDFEVVDYDTSTLSGATSCANVDAAPLSGVTPRGRSRKQPRRTRH